MGLEWPRTLPSYTGRRKRLLPPLFVAASSGEKKVHSRGYIDRGIWDAQRLYIGNQKLWEAPCLSKNIFQFCCRSTSKSCYNAIFHVPSRNTRKEENIIHQISTRHPFDTSLDQSLTRPCPVDRGTRLRVSWACELERPKSSS